MLGWIRQKLQAHADRQVAAYGVEALVGLTSEDGLEVARWQRRVKDDLKQAYRRRFPYSIPDAARERTRRDEFAGAWYEARGLSPSLVRRRPPGRLPVSRKVREWCIDQARFTKTWHTGRGGVDYFTRAYLAGFQLAEDQWLHFCRQRIHRRNLEHARVHWCFYRRTAEGKAEVIPVEERPP